MLCHPMKGAARGWQSALLWAMPPQDTSGRARTMATYVLIHGASSDAGYWHRVAPGPTCW